MRLPRGRLDKWNRGGRLDARERRWRTALVIGLAVAFVLA